MSTSTNLKVLDESIRSKLHDKGLQLADIPVNGMETNELGILIGSEHYWKVVTGRIERVNDTLVLLKSKFGWLAQRSIPTKINVSEIPDVETMHVSIGEEQELSNQLRRFWETESIGVTMEKGQSLENQEALRNFEETIKYDNRRYELRLPWKDEQTIIDNNYGPAENRFSMLVRKLQRNPTLYHRYNEVIQENLSEGIIEIVHSKSSENPIYYLPHHAIVGEKASKKKQQLS